MPQHLFQRNWQNASSSISAQQAVTADSETNQEIAVAAETTDLAVNLAVDVSALKGLFISSDQDVQIETNGSGGSADDTLQIKAGIPLIWSENCGFANPLTVDVATILITNAGDAAATVKICVLQDATP